MDPTTPVDPPQHGGLPQRGLGVTPNSSSFSGRFGRMFRQAAVYDIPDAALVHLAQAMVQPLEDGVLDKPVGEADDDENVDQLDGALRLPAGYTYFGQFVDHDITFDPVSTLQRQNDPDGLTDYRTPRFDLDNLYGRGPADQPYLYEADGVHLALGNTVSATEAIAGPDLARSSTGRAIIGDPRNDENLIVSQLQSIFLRFHNRVVDRVHADRPELEANDVFKLAQQRVRWHYQWIVIYDFLRRLVGDAVLEDILPLDNPMMPEATPPVVQRFRQPRLRFYRFRDEPFIPLEFSVAAYRFGHSMARPSYRINDLAVADPQVEGASRIPLFSQTEEPRQSLNGFRTLPNDWGVQWKFFLPGVGPAEDNLPQPSYKLDATLSHPLGALPSSVAGPELIVAGFAPEIATNLAVRNLIRGKRLGLPSGPDVARAMGIEPLTPQHLLGDVDLEAESRQALSGREPLWFYVLKEAQVLCGSAHLGPVGGRIVAEVLIGLLAGDPLSYLNVAPGWTPDLPRAAPETFTLSDLVNVADPPPQGPEPPPVYTP